MAFASHVDLGVPMAALGLQSEEVDVHGCLLVESSQRQIGRLLWRSPLAIRHRRGSLSPNLLQPCVPGAAWQVCKTSIRQFESARRLCRTGPRLRARSFPSPDYRLLFETLRDYELFQQLMRSKR